MPRKKLSDKVVDIVAGTFIFFGLWFFTWLTLYVLTRRFELENKSLIMIVLSFAISMMVFGYFRFQNFKNVKVSQSYIEYVTGSKRKDYLGRTVMNYGLMDDLPMMDVFTFDINGDNFIGQFVMRRRNNYGATTMVSNKVFKDLVSVVKPLIDLEEKTCTDYWEIFHDYSGAEEGMTRLDGLPKNFLVGYYPLFNRDILVEKESPIKQIEHGLERLNGEKLVEDIMDHMFIEYFKDITLESMKTSDVCEMDYCIVANERVYTITLVSEGYVSYIVDSAGYMFDEAKKVNQVKTSLVAPLNKQNELIREIFGKFMRISNIIVFTGDTINLKSNFESPTIHIAQPYKLQNLLKDANQDDAADQIMKLKNYVVDDRLYTRYDLIGDFMKMIEEGEMVKDRLDQTIDMLINSEDLLLKRKVAYKEWVKSEKYVFFSEPKYVKKFEKHVDNMFSLKYVFGVDNLNSYKADLSKAKTLMENYLSSLKAKKGEIEKIISGKSEEA